SGNSAAVSLSLYVSLHCIDAPETLHSFPTRRSSDLIFGGAKGAAIGAATGAGAGTAAVVAGGRNAATLPSGTPVTVRLIKPATVDRKSTRLNSSHRTISYAVFCLKKKTTKHTKHSTR